MTGPDSADLIGLYTREYYLHGVAGHEAFRRGDGGIAAITNMRRTLALALASPIERAVDVGAGRGELAKHLVAQSVAVTLVDYSPAAIEIARAFVGNHGSAGYLTISATELSRHVEPGSQDAVFLCDFAEHVSEGELRRVLAECALVLAPHGVLCLHSPERTCGAVLTTSAVEERHINLMDVADLQAALEASFGFAAAFTWNGTQAFCRPGRCIELFGVARRQGPFAREELAPQGAGAFAFPGERAAAAPFLLRGVMDGPCAGALRFLDAAGRPVLEAPFALEAHDVEPCVLLLASGLLPPDTPWDRVERLETAADGDAPGYTLFLPR